MLYFGDYIKYKKTYYWLPSLNFGETSGSLSLPHNLMKKILVIKAIIVILERHNLCKPLSLFFSPLWKKQMLISLFNAFEISGNLEKITKETIVSVII